jgi:predicted TIM-barrel enzyme
MSSSETMARVRATVASGSPIIVAGVGSGLTARGAASGGADVVAVYNTAVYRVRGVPTALAFLPYDDANALTLAAAPEVIAAAGQVPVLLGFGAHHPRWSLDRLLDRAQSLGAAGVTNEPFSGMYSEDLQAQLESAGLGFSREIELVRKAVERGMLALGWAFTSDEATRMAETGAQFIGAMVGVTAGGAAGGAALTPMDVALEKVDAVARAVKGVRTDAIVLAHGGPFNDPTSVALALERTSAQGYVTGSTGERIPVERAVARAIREFKSARVLATQT